MQPEYRSSRSRCVLYRGNGGAIDDERLGNDGAVCGRYPRRGRRSRYRRVRLRAGVDGHNAAVSVALERVDHLHGNGGGGQRPRLVERPGRVRLGRSGSFLSVGSSSGCRSASSCSVGSTRHRCASPSGGSRVSGHRRRRDPSNSMSSRTGSRRRTTDRGR